MNLRKTLASTAMAGVLLGGTLSAPAFAGSDHDHDDDHGHYYCDKHDKHVSKHAYYKWHADHDRSPGHDRKKHDHDHDYDYKHYDHKKKDRDYHRSWKKDDHHNRWDGDKKRDGDHRWDGDKKRDGDHRWDGKKKWDNDGRGKHHKDNYYRASKDKKGH